MSSLIGGGVNNVIGQGAGLLNSPGLLRELAGQQNRVQFMRQGQGIIFAADATINESHSREVVPSAYPIEDGSVISDNLMVAPFQLTLNGVVSDTPIYDAKHRLLQVFGEAAASLAPPLGIAVASAAYKLYTISQGASTPSKEAYQTLTRLQAGDPLARPPILPQPFIVMTGYKRYYNCIIARLQFDRDASTAGACVFNMTIVQIKRVAPQSVRLSILKNPALASGKQDVGEAPPSKIAAQYNQGKAEGFQAEQQKVGAIKSIGKFLNIGQG